MNTFKAYSKCGLFFCCLLPFFLAPHPVEAKVVITEIMYDPAQSDTGREWIEIHNDSNTAVDLALFRLKEEGSLHKIQSTGSTSILPAGEYAIIADSIAKFRTDFPAFQGKLFDSVFSLKNTGELLTIYRGDVSEFEILYDPLLGAAGNGDSLKFDGISWKAASSTPGTGDFRGTSQSDPEDSDSNSPTNDDDEAEGGEDSASATISAIQKNIPIFPHLNCTIIPPYNALAGAERVFEANGWGLQNEPLKNARYLWNFGDATIAEGKKVLHRFRRPGLYTVTMAVASGEYAGYCEKDFVAEKPLLIFSEYEKEIEGFVGITNRSARDLLLEGFGVRNGSSASTSMKDILSKQTFFFPEGTKIRAGSILMVANEVLGFLPSETLELVDRGGILVTVLFLERKMARPEPISEQKSEEKSEQKSVIATTSNNSPAVDSVASSSVTAHAADMATVSSATVLSQNELSPDAKGTSQRQILVALAIGSGILVFLIGKLMYAKMKQSSL